MQIFTSVDIALMGDMHPQFGQTYYGTVEEQVNPVRFNLKQVVDMAPGRKFVAEEVEHRTSKGSGKPYTQLKKVSLSESTPQVQNYEPQGEFVGHDEGFQDVPPETPMAGSLADEWTKHQPQAPSAVPSTNITPQTVAPTAKERPDYEKGTNARWAIGMAYRAYIQVMGSPEDGSGGFPFDAVQQHAQELLDMFEILTDKEE